jgi:hypothetical protein
MRSQSLEEFAEDMRRKGDIRDADLADDILALIDIETEVAEPYSDLCDELNWDVPEGLKDKPEKALEYLRDRSNMLADIEKLIAESDALPKTGPNGLPIKRDTDDAIRELLEALAERPEPLEYDL